MAIGFLRMSTISRGRGESVCARAAYILRARIEDPRTATTHDYTRKAAVLEASGVVGWNGDAPSLARAMSAAEKRRDACEGRSVILALPHELDAAARERLVVAWCEDLRVRHRVACAYALHLPDRHGDDRNFHAHVIISGRRSDGLALGEKTRELDTLKTGSTEVEAWRVAWAARCGEALKAAGVANAESAVEMKSWKRRLEAESLPAATIQPFEHLGPGRAALERRGRRTEAGERNRRRRQRRREIEPIINERARLARAATEGKAMETVKFETSTATTLKAEAGKPDTGPAWSAQKDGTLLLRDGGPDGALLGRVERGPHGWTAARTVEPGVPTRGWLFVGGGADRDKAASKLLDGIMFSKDERGGLLAGLVKLGTKETKAQSPASVSEQAARRAASRSRQAPKTGTSKAQRTVGSVRRVVDGLLDEAIAGARGKASDEDER